MSKTLDLTFIRQMMGNDEKVVQKFLVIFKDQCPRQLQELKQHYAAQHWPDLSTVAHSLKTQFKYLSVETLAAQVCEIETRAEEPPGTEAQRDELGALIRLFEAELLALLKDLPLPS